ncbi:hypothetical protein TRAPUB_12737, partial [Trametes pubescens]
VLRATIGVPTDPWDHVPRLAVSQINTIELVPHTPLPTHVKDSTEGTILLNTGDFVVLHLQFRVGDGNKITKDWEALSTLEAVFLPWVLWDGVTPLSNIAASLPTVQSSSSVESSQACGQLLCAPFDTQAVHHYFAHFIQSGQNAYMESHLGSARADLATTMDHSTFVMGDRLLRGIAQAGNLHVLVRRLREAGMDNVVDKFR